MARPAWRSEVEFYRPLVSRFIIPFSRGVQTKIEGVWDRVDDPNHYFKVFCWWVQ